MLLAKRIEESILTSKNNQLYKNDYLTDEMSILNDDYMPIHQKINKYKDSISELKAKLEGFYNLKRYYYKLINFDRVEFLESEIKNKKVLMDNLKHENNVLNNINKNQNKAMSQYVQKYENKGEVKVLQEKLKSLKEEYKYSKDLFKSTEVKIKNQNTIILSLEEKCQKIKDNIEFKKKSRDKETSNLNTPVSTFMVEKGEENQNIPEIEEKAKYSELQANNEEKNYKNEILKQQKIIKKLNDEVNILACQLKEKEQEIRINELKMKELRKINRHMSQLKGDREQTKNEETRAVSANMKTHHTHTIQHRPNINNNKNIATMSKTPNQNVKPFARNEIKFESYSSNNIAQNDLKGISYDTRGRSLNNYNNIHVQKGNSKENDELDKEDMLNQIEKLSNLIIEYIRG
jgi:hypothetical protein